ncbi:hypothetical protein HYN69_02895 [Gemmobacter aquarius]|uniref:Alginate lyase domain-containing protein n=1 Tax=Paragemmobacter aquarius TaxID=2169400 RepID=A0A2S0UID9_9RHOB|nr:alginate lyase family protein [Gemmobacter aquarius]AWB47592.1 hypothetical protein HYN69_02895 [Gemmobacter aquarius]
MRMLAFRLCLGFWAVVSLPFCLPVTAMTEEQRDALDLSSFVVNDSHAGLFDIRARHADLLGNGAPDRLHYRISLMRKPLSCADGMPFHIITGAQAIPGLYTDPRSWRDATEIYHMFQDRVARLAAAQMVSVDTGSGECLITLLDRWAQSSALSGFDIAVSGQQTWFEIEATLSAAAIAYSIVRELVPGHDAEKHRIEAWLVTSAWHHLSVRGGLDGACCNNHFYRRGLYAAVIGVVASDDALFRIGVSAIYSALSDASSSGNLRLEMKRGIMSAHYQNYAAMYLALIARMVQRQGYNPYDIAIEGKKLDDIFSNTVAIIRSPERVAIPAGANGQIAQFTSNPAYLVWLELVKERPGYGSDARALLAAVKPGYNRTMGGELSVYLANDFFRP